MAVAATEPTRSDLRSLSALSEIGRALAGGPELRSSLEKALEKLEQHRGILRGAVFLLEELLCRAALSIELPRPPQSEELPDAQVAQLLRGAFGGTDELADDGVAPAE